MHYFHHLLLVAFAAMTGVSFAGGYRTPGGKDFTVSEREIFVDHQRNHRSGHMGHALVDAGKGRILDFNSNCDGDRLGGHSGYGWMEYRISDDYGRTWGAPRTLPYSRRLFEEGKHTALCEKAVKAPDGRIILFFQITDASQEICCEPWSAPTMAVSTDNGETFSDGIPTGAEAGRIYDAVADAKGVYFLIQANEHFLGTRPEHVYKVYRSDAGGPFVPTTLPIDAKGKGYGALEVASDGSLIAYIYDSRREDALEYTISRDRGKTWSAPARSRVAKLIRNPQVRRLGDVWFLIGRNGGSGDGLVLYSSEDGINWDGGHQIDRRPPGGGTGYYGCLLPIHEPGCAPRMLMQYSHVYSLHRVNIAHRTITFQPSTLAHWPLACDPKTGEPDGRCAESSAAELFIPEVSAVSPLGADGRTALAVRRSAGTGDLAYSDTMGRYTSPTRDFTVEGWYTFTDLPEKGGVWMVVSAVPCAGCRWFLTLRHDSFHPGYTWQIYSSLPDTRDTLLTTVTDLSTLTNGWHHFALTHAAENAAGKTEWRLYLDGQPAGSRVVDAFRGAEPPSNGGGRLGFGGRGLPGNLIAGSLSDCRLSNRVLDPSEFLCATEADGAHRARPVWKEMPRAAVADRPSGGRTLPNGIRLPREWPPKIDADDLNPIRAPYLEPANIPNPAPIDLGRQLFVDDFLVGETAGVVRAFYKPVKHVANPVFWPETRSELAQDTVIGDHPYPAKGERMAHTPGCVMPGGGVWWDPTRRRFRMWYLPGWWGRISYAESEDGVHWTRPAVGPNGDNIVLPHQMSDTFSVWPDYAAADPYGHWCMSISPGGNPTRSALYTSPDGVHWRFRRLTGEHGDSTTMLYDPFLGKWVWSLRAGWRARSRVYHAHDDFLAGGDWHFPMYGARTNTCDCFLWLACDNQDLTRTVEGKVCTNAQLYNVDAVPYESIQVGVFKILCGRDNEESARGGMPKTTTVHFAYSRDGFHFTRPDRTPAIPDSGWGSGQWDSGYVGPCSSGFVINDERLWFFYTGLRGDACATNPPNCVAENGMHWNGAIGVATLRRDGFAGLVADGRGTVTTRPVVFSGAHLFVNADARFGALAVDVLDEKGAPVPGYTAADCAGFTRVDSTKRAVTWKGGDLSRFAGRPVRFRFNLRVATLYSFWVSKEPTGESGGYVAAGGPAYRGLCDL